MFNIVSAKLTGTPGASGWAQVHEFAPQEPDKISLRGHLFAVVATRRLEGAVNTSVGLDSLESGRELISRLHEEYFGDLTAKPFNALQIAVEKVQKEFKESWGDVEIAASSIVEGVVYSAACGGAKVLISRGGALGTILVSEGDGVISASGFPQRGDVMLMATRPFFGKVSQGVIKAALGAPTPEGAIEVFAPAVHGGEEEGNMGAVVMRFEERVAQPAFVPGIAPSVRRPDVGKKIFELLGRISRKIPGRKIYVRSPFEEDATSQSRKLTFSVGIILLVVLAISIVFGVRQKRINDLKGRYQGILRQAEADIDQAINLASVSPDKSRELFLDSEQKLARIVALKVKDPKVDDLRKKIDDTRASILGEYLVSPEPFLDLTLLSSGFKGDVESVSGGSVYVMDSAGKRIVSVAIDTKKSKVVAGPSTIDEVEGLAAYEDRVFILAGDGIYEVGKGKTKVVGKTWQGDALIRAFAGNIYVLDKNGNAIYRYAGSGNSFGDKQNWLAGGTRVNFSDAKKWVIDGAVYVLFPNSKILKFSLGSPQNFTLTGAVPEIGKIDDIYADPDNKGVYLLDRAGKRVVVIDKSGKYTAQYIGNGISAATNIVVSESAKKIILLTGDKLFSIELKHL